MIDADFFFFNPNTFNSAKLEGRGGKHVHRKSHSTYILPSNSSLGLPPTGPEKL